MIKYIIKRILFGALTLWVIMTLTFILMHAIPGGPFDMDSLDSMNESVRENLMMQFGLDRPVIEQYFIYIGNLFKGHMGVSYAYAPRTVESIIARQLPISMTLGAASLGLTVVFGLLWGVLAALKQGKWLDNILKVMTTMGVTIPSFVMSMMLIYVFAVKLMWLPTSGFVGPKHLILPAVALSFSSIAYLSRLTRSSLLDVIRQDYIRTARQKGLPEQTVILKHALKNCLLPIITYLGHLMAMILMGSFVVEKIFSIPGIGREMVSAVSNRDYTMILGLTLFFSLIIICTYLIIDIACVLVDPRVKLENK